MTAYVVRDSFVTPFVAGDEAEFGNKLGDHFELRYGFRFACLGWRYSVIGYMTNAIPFAEMQNERIVELESPDKKTRISTKLITVALSSAFSRPLTEWQIQEQTKAQAKLDLDYQRSEAIGIRVMSRSTAVYPDPLTRADRILAEEELIGRLLSGGADNFKLGEANQIRYETLTISNKEFVQGNAGVVTGNCSKQCVIWALNVSGYRWKDRPEERRAVFWVCEVISDASELTAIQAKARRIPETLEFSASDQNVYPELRD